MKIYKQPFFLGFSVPLILFWGPLIVTGNFGIPFYKFLLKESGGVSILGTALYILIGTLVGGTIALIIDRMIADSKESNDGSVTGAARWSRRYISALIGALVYMALFMFSVMALMFNTLNSLKF